MLHLRSTRAVTSAVTSTVTFAATLAVTLAVTLAAPPAVTQAVDPAFESSFFDECVRRQMTLLTVSHRREASAHHTHKLRLDGSGAASVSAIDGNKGDDSSTSDDFVHAEH